GAWPGGSRRRPGRGPDPGPQPQVHRQAVHRGRGHRQRTGDRTDPPGAGLSPQPHLKSAGRLLGRSESAVPRVERDQTGAGKAPVTGKLARVNVRLHDSATREVRDFVPRTPGHVSIYLCGATVQGAPHIGHLRSAIAFDILVRWLRRSGLEVTLVRNVTDIDDKILIKSAEAGVPWWAWAHRFEREFTSAYDALGVLPPTYEPRATGHIPEMIDLIERLISCGHAYTGDAGNVYFDVRSWPEYGRLTHQSLDQLTTAEDDEASDKRDPRDFALWKAAKDTDPPGAGWDTPWGRG